jgi:hypothetical protein
LKTLRGCFRGDEYAFNHDVNVTKLETDTKCSVVEHVQEIEQKATELLESLEDAKSKEAMQGDDA